MCYFSLKAASRRARGDEVLLVERLSRSRKGLFSPEDTSTVVCLTTGIRLELLFIPDITRDRYDLKGEERATFRVRYWMRRDILLLDCGCVLPFQNLEIGQVVRILSDTVDFLPSPSVDGELINTLDSVGSQPTRK